MSSSGALSGARIWLSGAIPTAIEDDSQGKAILDFVRTFSRAVFEHGGYVVHGSHPSLTPTLLEEARAFQSGGGRKDCLTLAVSRHFSKDPAKANVQEWRKAAIVYETADVKDDVPHSLQILRQWMASRADAIVVVGGNWWGTSIGKPGVPAELELGIERGLPCFLLGGYGGAARDFLGNNPGIVSMLRNGLPDVENLALATAKPGPDIAYSVCQYLLRLPLVRGAPTEGISFRILALDGGGIKGAFTAAAIAAWEKSTGLRVAEHFDLIAGTSTGGILALGLGLGLSGQEMLDFYRSRGPVIFPVMRFQMRIWRKLRHWFRPKYAQKVLLKELENALSKRGRPARLMDSKVRLLIPSYHVAAGASHQFRTPHHPDLTADATVEMAHAGLATAAAPTFFAAAKIANMVAAAAFFDGGVWANSPAMAAIVEATCFLRVPVERLDVLSVGTTEEPFTVSRQARAGKLGWIWRNRIIELLMNVQQESSLRLARHLVGDPRFLRVNTVTMHGTYALDGVRDIEELADLGSREALKPDVLSQVKSRFLNGIKVAPWQRFK